MAADGRGVAERTQFVWDGPVLAEQTTEIPGELPHHATLSWDHEGLTPVAQTERLTDAATRREVDARFFAIATDLIGTPTELIDEDGRIAWQNRLSTPRARGSLGSKSMPPLAPPTGRSNVAVLAAIPRARSSTSDRVQPARMRVPPVARPETSVCTTR